MENREILGVILAVAVVLVAMGIISMVRDSREDDTPETSIVSSSSVPVHTTKDIWDEIREQQETTVTSVSADGTMPLATDETMPISTDGTQIESLSTVTETQVETMTNSAGTTTKPVFNLVIP